MTNPKRHGITKKMLTVPERAVVKTLHADAQAQIENAREMGRDPKLAKARTQLLDQINDDIAKTWREPRLPGSAPRSLRPTSASNSSERERPSCRGTWPSSAA